jgi:hypothetical protein
LRITTAPYSYPVACSLAITLENRRGKIPGGIDVSRIISCRMYEQYTFALCVANRIIHPFF